MGFDFSTFGDETAENMLALALYLKASMPNETSFPVPNSEQTKAYKARAQDILSEYVTKNLSKEQARRLAAAETAAYEEVKKEATIEIPKRVDRTIVAHLDNLKEKLEANKVEISRKLEAGSSFSRQVTISILTTLIVSVVFVLAGWIAGAEISFN